jgi:outer membrane receptor for ferrienterochelin and colicins
VVHAALALKPRLFLSMRLLLFASLLTILGSTSSLAQTPDRGTITIEARHDAEPVTGVLVLSGAIGAVTDATGRARLSLTTGDHRIGLTRIGIVAETLSVFVRSGLDTLIVVQLRETETTLASIMVAATRSERRIEDQPLRVEVLAREEVEEKMLMTPGDISMMLNETSGLRVQTTSPSLGGANVRIQGLRGRYTQMLADGLPLYGGQTGSLGLLQVPPMDLAQVEVIKGVASALYGGSALGGVVNLVSRRTGESAERDLLVNLTTLGGADAVGFASAPLNATWGYTLLAGAHRQARAWIGTTSTVPC